MSWCRAALAAMWLPACADEGLELDASVPADLRSDAEGAADDDARGGADAILGAVLCERDSEREMSNRPCGGAAYCLSSSLQCCPDGSNCLRVFACSCTPEDVFACSPVDTACPDR